MLAGTRMALSRGTRLGVLTMTTIALILLSIIPHPAAIVDRVDVCEVNHYYDSCGVENFKQIIWWRWNKHRCRHEVYDWRIVKEPQQLPIAGRCVWFDSGELRAVEARITVETWTQFDPELHNRATLEASKRRGLSWPARRELEAIGRE